MSGVDLVDRDVGDGGVVPLPHEIGLLRCLPAGIRQRHVVEALELRGLERARRVHRGRGGGPHEGRRLLDARRLRGRDRDDLVRDDELPQRIERVLGRLQQLRGRRMVPLQRGQHGIGGLARVDLLRRVLERQLVRLAIALRDGEQAIEREVDHLVGGQRPPVRLGAERITTGRPGQQIGLEERLVLAQRGDHGVVAGLEGGAERGVRHLREGRRNVLPEEADVAVDLLDRDLGIDPGRIHEVPARLGEQPWHPVLAIDQRPEPVRGRGIRALHHDVGPVGDGAAVDVRVRGPRLDHVVCQDAGVERLQNLLAVEPGVGRKRRRIDG